jgi:elongation factor Ts
MVVRREDVPERMLEHEKEIYRTQALNEGKPEKVLDKIVNGRLEKFYQEACLLEQPFVKDAEKTIQDLQTDLIARIGEKIMIRRFARFRLGGDEE